MAAPPSGQGVPTSPVPPKKSIPIHLIDDLAHPPPEVPDLVGLPSYVSIEYEGNFFDTRSQITFRDDRRFIDTSGPSIVSGTTTVTGLFSRKHHAPDDVIMNSSTHATSSTITDPSGNSRKILALNIDYYASSSVDAYRNGVELTQEKHWAAGLVKISAGTPGHLFQPGRYGDPQTSVIDPDRFTEIDTFDPVRYVATGGDPDLFTYPIVTSDYNLQENYILDGIIEPLPIRPVVSNFSINFPFEPHSMKAEFGSGNSGMRPASDQVLSIDYVNTRQNMEPYLDACDAVTLAAQSGSVRLGPSNGYFNTDHNDLLPWNDEPHPRGVILDATMYESDMIDAINDMLPGGTTYVAYNQRSAACGFDYIDSSTGVDSIAFGGRTHL